MVSRVVEFVEKVEIPGQTAMAVPLVTVSLRDKTDHEHSLSELVERLNHSETEKDFVVFHLDSDETLENHTSDVFTSIILTYLFTKSVSILYQGILEHCLDAMNATNVAVLFSKSLVDGKVTITIDTVGQE